VSGETHLPFKQHFNSTSVRIFVLLVSQTWVLLLPLNLLLLHSFQLIGSHDSSSAA
jgi:hypothetical protein